MQNFSVQAIYNWYRSTLRNPKYRWFVVGASLLYLLSPLDISPDIFPIVGWLDDGIIIGLLVAELSQIMTERLQSGGKNGGKAGETAAEGSTTTTAKTAETVDVKAVVTEVAKDE